MGEQVSPNQNHYLKETIMSATTYFTRKEELSYEGKSRLVQETEVWCQDGADFSIDVVTQLTEDSTTATVELEDIITFASLNGYKGLEEALKQELTRENLDSTDYEVVVSY